MDDGMGHVLKADITVEKGMVIKSSKKSNSLSLIQKLIIIASIIWGALGTALYFRGKKG